MTSSITELFMLKRSLISRMFHPNNVRRFIWQERGKMT